MPTGWISTKARTAAVSAAQQCAEASALLNEKGRIQHEKVRSMTRRASPIVVRCAHFQLKATGGTAMADPETATGKGLGRLL